MSTCSNGHSKLQRYQRRTGEERCHNHSSERIRVGRGGCKSDGGLFCTFSVRLSFFTPALDLSIPVRKPGWAVARRK